MTLIALRAHLQKVGTSVEAGVRTNERVCIAADALNHRQGCILLFVVVAAVEGDVLGAFVFVEIAGLEGLS